MVVQMMDHLCELSSKAAVEHEGSSAYTQMAPCMYRHRKPKGDHLCIDMDGPPPPPPPPRPLPRQIIRYRDHLSCMGGLCVY
jgi:hypothetical protein